MTLVTVTPLGMGATSAEKIASVKNKREKKVVNCERIAVFEKKGHIEESVCLIQASCLTITDLALFVIINLKNKVRRLELEWRAKH